MKEKEVRTIVMTINGREILVTPQMIDSGLEELFEYGPRGPDPEDVVVSIFRKMLSFVCFD